MTERPSVPIAPFAAAFVPAVWIFVFQLTTRYPFIRDTAGALVLSLIIYGCSVPVAWACGYVTLNGLRRFDLIHWWTVTCAGAICGILVSMAFPKTQPSAEAFFAWGGVGGASGFIYWAVWRYVDKGAGLSLPATSNNRWRGP